MLPSVNASRLVRQLHLYVGVLIAPSVLFFALTGALQLFTLHEAHKDSGYTPAVVIEKLSEVHIHQRFAEPPKKKRPAPSQAAPAVKAVVAAKPPAEEEGAPPIKWVFLAVALGLVVSTCLGLWMGLTQSRNRRLALALLVIGAIVPVLLLAL